MRVVSVRNTCTIRGYCYRWSWFEARSKICSAKRQAKVHEKNKVKIWGLTVKEFLLCAVHWYVVKVWASRLLVLSSWRHLSREGMRHDFSYGYNHIAALSPWEQYILYPFRLTAIRQLLCLIRVEPAKLAQSGFGGYLAEALLSRLKGNCDDNKEVYWLVQFDKCRTHIDWLWIVKYKNLIDCVNKTREARPQISFLWSSR
jgi:hypothetical protein